MFSWTVIATTGKQFIGFAPYVASINNSGMVAFQARLPSGGSAIFIGDGNGVRQVTTVARLPDVISHPDLNDAGEVSFYADRPGGGQAVLLLRGGEFHTIAQTGAGFAGIGPLGPTINAGGMVAFRANRTRRRAGVFLGDTTSVVTVAETGRDWRRFHGLPVVDGDMVVFRADRQDGRQGIYAARAGSIRPVAESGERFASLGFFPTANRHGTVAFTATLPDGSQGAFVADEGRVTRIAGPSGAFGGFRGALITDGGAVVLITTPQGGQLGLFAGPDPKEDRILGLGDALLGSSVTDFAANPVSVNAAGQVATRAALADGRELILRADPARA